MSLVALCTRCHHPLGIHEVIERTAAQVEAGAAEWRDCQAAGCSCYLRSYELTTYVDDDPVPGTPEGDVPPEAAPRDWELAPELVTELHHLVDQYGARGVVLAVDQLYPGAIPTVPCPEVELLPCPDVELVTMPAMVRLELQGQVGPVWVAPQHVVTVTASPMSSPDAGTVMVTMVRVLGHPDAIRVAGTPEDTAARLFGLAD